MSTPTSATASQYTVTLPKSDKLASIRAFAQTHLGVSHDGLTKKQMHHSVINTIAGNTFTPETASVKEMKKVQNASKAFVNASGSLLQTATRINDAEKKLLGGADGAARMGALLADKTEKVKHTADVLKHIIDYKTQVALHETEAAAKRMVDRKGAPPQRPQRICPVGGGLLASAADLKAGKALVIKK